MKQVKKKVNKTLAKVTLITAKKGAGMASLLGWYQPRVPERLSK
ncbi:MAG: cyclic lactone autoinducer peptide [Oscillospiraceae bacterium]|jgi:cyclic lactone autoinducer peptide|nr:cyclic lactone autoinducer peptide [Oscillospiraceae bacterium]